MNNALQWVHKSREHLRRLFHVHEASAYIQQLPDDRIYSSQKARTWSQKFNVKFQRFSLQRWDAKIFQQWELKFSTQTDPTQAHITMQERQGSMPPCLLRNYSLILMRSDQKITYTFAPWAGKSPRRNPGFEPAWLYRWPIITSALLMKIRKLTLYLHARRTQTSCSSVVCWLLLLWKNGDFTNEWLWECCCSSARNPFGKYIKVIVFSLSQPFRLHINCANTAAK